MQKWFAEMKSDAIAEMSAETEEKGVKTICYCIEIVQILCDKVQ
jgi:hypothetical protein